VSTMGVLYAVGGEGEQEEALKDVLKRRYDPLTAFTLMVFTLLYIPCLVSIAVIKRETNSWRWALFSIFYLTALAWITSLVVYQGGKFLGLG